VYFAIASSGDEALLSNVSHATSGPFMIELLTLDFRHRILGTDSFGGERHSGETYSQRHVSYHHEISTNQVYNMYHVNGILHQFNLGKIAQIALKVAEFAYLALVKIEITKMALTA